MRNLDELNQYRNTSADVIKYYGSVGDASNGIFDVCGLLVIAAQSDGWEHVSVSTKKRIPTWMEMEKIKRMFFKNDETVMQLHVPPSDHVNICKTALHLWRPINEVIPRPPVWMVG